MRKIWCADFSIRNERKRMDERTDKRESIGLRDSLETKNYILNRGEKTETVHVGTHHYPGQQFLLQIGWK